MPVAAAGAAPRDAIGIEPMVEWPPRAENALAGPLCFQEEPGSAETLVVGYSGQLPPIADIERADGVFPENRRTPTIAKVKPPKD
jgi:hypothetical protein